VTAWPGRAATSPLSIECTLAWQQLDEGARQRWKAVGELAARRFEDTPVELRRRWARTGTSVPNAVLLQQLATQVRTELAGAMDPSDPVAAFLLVSDNGRLAQLLAINATRAARFRPLRNTPRNAAFDVDLRALIVDWLQGREIAEIGETYLGAVLDETYRYEQLSEFISQILEHLLPWLLNTLVGWVNEGLAEENHVCSELPAYIRFGVNTRVALELCQSGVRSRRLVHVVAAAATALPVRDWLAETDVRTWGRLFDASPSELADLLLFTGVRDARITSRVLAGEAVEVPLVIEGFASPGAVELREVNEDPPPRLAAFREGQVVGYVRRGHHNDVSRLLAIGIPLSIAMTEELTMRILLDDPTERAVWFGDGNS
jgi:hypothetical protein